MDVIRVKLGRANPSGSLRCQVLVYAGRVGRPTEVVFPALVLDARPGRLAWFPEDMSQTTKRTL